MIYEKPEIFVQKFYTEPFLEEMSSGGGGNEHEIYGSTTGYNIDISYDSNGVGGWFNG